MIHKLTIKKGFDFLLILLVCVFSTFYLHAQNQLDEKFKEFVCQYGIEYQIPKNYHGIVPESCYSPDGTIMQSALDHSIKCETIDIVVAFALMSRKPDYTPRGIRIREVFGDPNKINLKAIAIESDTTLSKMSYIDSLELKKINADRGVIYNMKIYAIFKYKGIYARCKKIEIFKDNVAKAEILFFYNKGDDALVDQEIKKTWEMLKFKS